jgi:hypothetical protein
MTVSTTRTGSRQHSPSPDLIRAARVTGLLYLGLAVTALLGSLWIRNELFVADDPGATLSNLVEHDLLARLGIALDMGAVLAQTLTALWFYRLFRSIDSFAAGSIAAFGMVNAVVMMAAATLLATALDVGGDASLAEVSDRAGTAQVLIVASDHLPGIGAMFFGLWLIPMGWLVLRSGWLPRPLGHVLMIGGAGYVVSAFARYLFPDADLAALLLTVPATIGEFWILGYLIIWGVRDRGPTPDSLIAEP